MFSIILLSFFKEEEAFENDNDNNNPILCLNSVDS